MSLSVDDLVSSLSSSHIGQEAIDLAALQAQLSQTLFGQPLSSNGTRQIQRGHTQPCTTPIARTPSNHGFVHMAGRHMEEVDEDERMVEELLIPSSPIAAVAPSFCSQYPFAGPSHQPMSPPSGHLPSYIPVSSDPSPSPSVFTSTDPFYLAAMQQEQQQHQSASLFAQNGCLAQNSPFVALQHQQHRENHTHHPLNIDTHAIFASTAY